MAKNLFDYVNNSSNQSDTKTETVNEDYIKNKVNEYASLSENEMMSKLYSEVKKSKNNGTFNYNDLSSKLDSIKSYLTPEQKNKLEALLEKIRWVWKI